MDLSNLCGTFSALTAAGVNKLFEYGGLVITLFLYGVVSNLVLLLFIKALWKNNVQQGKDMIDMARDDIAVKGQMNVTLENNKP